MRTFLTALLAPALATTALAQVVGTVDRTAYVGCYTDLQGALNNQRALSADFYNIPYATAANCQARMARYPFFGMEYGTECYGGYFITPGSVHAAESSCNVGCAGNSSQLCGGGYRIQLYRNTYLTPQYVDPMDCAPGTMASTVTAMVTITMVQNVTMVVTVTESAG